MGVIKQLLSNWVRPIRLASRYKKPIKYKLKFIYFWRLAKRNGVISFRCDRVADLYTRDWFEFSGTTTEQKKWAYSHGFSSYKMASWYGISMSNYRQYVSDFDFYAPRTYISDANILGLFENKLNTYFALAPFADSMPIHHWCVREGKLIPLAYAGSVGYSRIEDMLELIKVKPLVGKACYGGHGAGLYKFNYADGQYFVNDKKSSLEECRSIVENMGEYIITDYVTPHHFFEDLCGKGTFAVLRMITVFDEYDGPQISCAAIRLGCKAAGITTDHEGTIYCGLSLDEGVSFKPLIRVADNKYDPIDRHPDTGKVLTGFVLPNYAMLKELVKAVSRYLPMTPYLVMDIIPVENGFSILEINSHGQTGNIEPFYPFCANEYNRRVFKINL